MTVAALDDDTPEQLVSAGNSVTEVANTLSLGAVWVRPTTSITEAGGVAELLAHLASQWRGDDDTHVVLERATADDEHSLGIADVMVHLGIQAESAAGLGEAWLAAQLACDRTPTGDLLGARIALAPERGKWRVHVVVPLLGRSFRSGKLNETPGGALRSAAVRLRRRAATLLLQPSPGTDA
jgi:hypothetical protein